MKNKRNKKVPSPFWDTVHDIRNMSITLISSNSHVEKKKYFFSERLHE